MNSVRTAIFTIAALIPTVAPAMAADLCQTVIASGRVSVNALLDLTSNGIVRVADPSVFPEDVTTFVEANPAFTPPTPPVELLPLGSDGAGMAQYIDGSARDQYLLFFDRVKGRLQSIEPPDVWGRHGEGYVFIATIGGIPAAVMSRDGKKRQTITRIVSWENHKWGAPCEIVIDFADAQKSKMHSAKARQATAYTPEPAK